jgi:hypothetical protein
LDKGIFTFRGKQWVGANSNNDEVKENGGETTLLKDKSDITKKGAERSKKSEQEGAEAGLLLKTLIDALQIQVEQSHRNKLCCS